MPSSDHDPQETELVESTTESADVEVDDDALEIASGGQMVNSTEIVFGSTFIPFDSSF